MINNDETPRCCRIKNNGQSLWLDYLSRDLIQSGELARLIKEDGVTGVTTNPLIFMKAIIGSSAYDADIKRLAKQGKSSLEIYFRITKEDVLAAAEILRSVYEATDGLDGYVSIEVIPDVAFDTDRTVKEAEELFIEDDRENVMVKIPGTDAGLPAVEELTARGSNINVTLLYSRGQYKKAAQAYLSGLKRRHKQDLALSPICSVASVYLSRTDVKFDRLLEKIASDRKDAAERKKILSYKGKAAVCSAKSVYKAFLEYTASTEWRRLAAAGACLQRPLWASMSPKTADLDKLAYVEAVIGRDTITTLPEETLLAFRERGRGEPTLALGLEEALKTLLDIADLGVDVAETYADLQNEMVIVFTHSFNLLIEAIEEKRRLAVR